MSRSHNHPRLTYLQETPYYLSRLIFASTVKIIIIIDLVIIIIIIMTYVIQLD